MLERIALLCPTLWDRRQLEACRSQWQERVEPVWLGPEDEEVPSDLDVPALVESCVRAHRGRLHGVLSSSDYPGAVAAALLAERLGLPGPAPRAVLEAGHKALARERQREAVLEAVPRTWVLDPEAPGTWPRDLPFPAFVKPVRGSHSVLARRVESRADLEAFLAHAAVRAHGSTYVAIHRALQARLSRSAPDPRCFLLEELLHGQQVTVEGWIVGGRVHVLGLADSILHPGTHAFARFEVPSALPVHVQARLTEVARRAVAASGLDQTLWNVELIWDPRTESAWILELNPRLCGQFADLWQKTAGVNTYLLAMALARGETPRAPRTPGAFPVAASVPLRTFRPVEVLEAPLAGRVAEVERQFPGTLVWWECRRGQELAGFDAAGEGQGLRYAVINVGASRRDELQAKAAAVEAALAPHFRPL